MAAKGRPPIVSRSLSTVIKSMSHGFCLNTLRTLELAGWCYKAESGPAGIPDVTHWQILYHCKVRTSTWDDKIPEWAWWIWIFEEEVLWRQVVQFYYDDAADMTSPTCTYRNGAMKIVFLDCSGKVIPHVSVALAFDRRGQYQPTEE